VKIKIKVGKLGVNKNSGMLNPLFGFTDRNAGDWEIGESISANCRETRQRVSR